MGRPNTVTALEPDPNEVSNLEKLIGGVTLGGFVAIWISSVASPALLGLAIHRGYHLTAAFIVVVTAAAYAPWTKGPLARSVQRFVGYYSPRYFKSITLRFEGDHLPSPSTDPQTFYAVHPHGAFCCGWAMLFCHPAMEHVRFCFAPALYLSPLFRLFSRCVGNPGSAAKFAMTSYLDAGEHLALPPGGFEEATLASTRHDRVFVKKRTGFIRLCLRRGAAVRPVYVFGEKGLYWNVQGAWKLRLALNRYGLPTIVTWGHPLFPLVPRRTVDLAIVVGAPIQLPKIDRPSREDVAEWHGKYVAALTRVFDEYKELAYGPDGGKTCKLEVW